MNQREIIEEVSGLYATKDFYGRTFKQLIPDSIRVEFAERLIQKVLERQRQENHEYMQML